MRIHVVGIGLDGATGLSESVHKIINKATVLMGSYRHLSYFPDHPATRLIFKDLTEVIDSLNHFISQKEFIVILATGDPLFFGIGRFLLEHFPPEFLQFYPHLSCVQLAFNRLKIPSQDAQIISVHGRELEVLIPLFQKGIKKLAILTDNIHHPAAIAQLYLHLEIPQNHEIWVCENLGDTSEKITRYSSQEIAFLSHKTAQDFASLNVVIFLETLQESKISLDKIPILGLQDQDFFSFSDHPSLMTKKEIRLLILGELALQDGQIIWDIGAGTGSVTIEMARLCPHSPIYAIEKTSMGIHLIQKNCQRFNVNNVIPIQANAPHKMDELPSPHRIFIGGTGNHLLEILEICQQKLHTEGRIIIALATLENLSQSLTWLQKNNWIYDLLQIQISRSVPIANLTRFSPLNPVTLITAHR